MDRLHPSLGALERLMDTSPGSAPRVGAPLPGAAPPADAAPADRLAGEALLAKAAGLARAGRRSEALRVLSGADAVPGARDLRARVYAQAGRFADAEAEWRRVIEADPANEASLAGLRRIAALQRGRTTGRRAYAAAVAVAIVLLLLWAPWAGGEGAEPPRPTPGAGEVRADVAALRADVAALRGDLARLAAPARDVPPAAEFDLPGVRARTVDGALTLSFEEGLFAAGAALKPGSAQVLAALGEVLQAYANRVSVHVTGYTDDVPVPPGERYRDNVALGIDRARIVADRLRAAGLPADALLISSPGGQGAPYPNDGVRNRLRNRTAVLRVSALPRR